MNRSEYRAILRNRSLKEDGIDIVQWGMIMPDKKNDSPCTIHTWGGLITGGGGVLWRTCRTCGWRKLSNFKDRIKYEAHGIIDKARLMKPNKEWVLVRYAEWRRNNAINDSVLVQRVRRTHDGWAVNVWTEEFPPNEVMRFVYRTRAQARDSWYDDRPDPLRNRLEPKNGFIRFADEGE